MTWEETICFIRTQNEFNYLVEKAYFEENLSLNVERYIESDEFLEIISKIKKYAPNAKKILDIGSGNGITSVAFALKGFQVISVEPDPSETIGAGAIRILKREYNLDKLEIHEAFAEDLGFKDGEFDIVFARQCMHHAGNLKKFVSESSRVLKKGGMFFTVRDHLIFDEKDKNWFLEMHPLQSYYGGENAFTNWEYKSAINDTNLLLIEELRYHDSIINYFPETKIQMDLVKKNIFSGSFFRRLIFFIPILNNKFLSIELDKREKMIPGRMYSYIALKK
jgi:SAM-dependent methyltransferase